MDTTPQFTLITTGMLPFLVLVAAALTAPVSVLLLAWYRRAVLRSMGAAGSGPPPAPPVAGPPPPQALQLDNATASAADRPAAAAVRHSLRGLAYAYVGGGLAYALVMFGAWQFFTRDDGFVLSRFLWLMSCYAWPAALAIGLVVAVDRRQRLLVALAYFAIVLAVALYGLLRNAELSVGQVVTFWLLTNAPATVLLLAFLHRRVRAVGPLVLSFMVAAVTGSQLAVSLVGSSEAAMRAVVALGAPLGLGGHTLFVLTMALGAVIAALAGWRLLLWLGRRHRARRSSDQALTLDAMWLLFGVVQSITLAFEGWVWVLSGLAAFAAYLAVSRIGWALARPVDRGRAPSLLLLRVFALGARSERLFDALAKRWLRIGDIGLIAGPDLATSTVEPHEFLDFVSGRLSRRFVASADDLDQRIAGRELGPDPDGRYRVNEVFCHADTWQLAMRRLAALADVVLMDLRSFSAANQGCLYELGHLLDAVALPRVVFLVDASTDRAFLEDALARLWRKVSVDSPNRREAAPRARIVAIDKGDAASLAVLLAHLHAAVAPSPELPQPARSAGPAAA